MRRGLLHAGVAHDVACASAAEVGHDPSAHKVAAPSGPAETDAHCVACHLARAPRLGAKLESIAAHVREGRALRPAPAIGSARTAALASLPPRSPPTFS